MCIEEAVVRQKYNAKPTHTATEIRSLAHRFPESIKTLRCVEKSSLWLQALSFMKTEESSTHNIWHRTECRKKNRRT